MKKISVSDKTVKKHRNDFILVFLLIIISLCSFAGYHLFYHKNGAYVNVTVDGELYKTLPLDTDTTLTITCRDGSTNILVIKDGYADIVDADCPDKLCVKQKKIHYQGETLVCLPHKIVVSISSDDESELDSVAS